ncbi:NYN domain-containing protein [Rhodocollybia butyracea]|uniref:NYN domain-containing protein n=1 Tax=Rhodocollybia butyracea TaxID=206335 RepID=A0A9P5Q0B2_9AGAR|nr:NYN domain-containing protein [Rhodocollybia butyracea]
MEKLKQVAVFWDYDNCSVPSSFKSGYEIVKQIREVAQEFGSIKLLRAYSQLTEQALLSSRSSLLRSELQSSGVSITDCPQNGFKNVADQMIIVDMLTFAMDNLANSLSTTILLISGDKDFAYALSVLRLRMYNVVVVAPSTSHQSLRAQVSEFLDWSTSILDGVSSREELSPFNDSSTQATRARRRTTLTSETTNPSLSQAAPTLNPVAHDTPIPAIAPISHTPHSGFHTSSILKETSQLLHSPSPPPPSHSSSLPSHSSIALPEVQSLQNIQFGHSNDRNMDMSPPGYSTERAEALLAFNPNPLYIRGHTAIATASLNHGISGDVLSSVTVDPGANLHPTLVQSRLVALPSRAPLPPSPRPRSADPSFPATILSNPHTVFAEALARQSGDADTLNLSSQSSAPYASLDKPAQAVGDSPTTGEGDSRAFGDTKPGNNGLSGGVRVSTTPAIAVTGLSQAPRSTSTVAPLNQASVLSTKDLPVQTPASGASTTSSVGSTSTVPLSNPASVLPAKALPVKSPASVASSSVGSTSTLKALPAAPLGPSPLKAIPQSFLPLLQHLEKARLKGSSKLFMSPVANYLKNDKSIYQRAGCSRFRDYTAEALKLGLIRLGGAEEGGGGGWIRLHPDLHGRIELKS